MGVLSQLGLLLGKDFTLLARQPVVLTLQFLWPLTLVVIVAVVRQAMPPEPRPACTYPTRSMPSSGVINFMQSFVCNINNKCTNVDQSAAQAAQAGDRISKIFKYLEPLAKSNGTSGSVLKQLPKSVKALGKLKDVFEEPDVNKFLNLDLRLRNFFKDPEKVKRILVTDGQILDAMSVEALLDATLNIYELYDLIGYIDFRGIVCTQARLEKYLIFTKGSNVKQVSVQLCKIDADKIPALIEEIQRQIDVKYIFDVAARIADFMGEYSISKAFDDIATIFDNAMSFDLLKDVQKAIPTLLKISSMLRRTGKLMENISDSEMDIVNKTFAMFAAAMNELDPVIKSFIHDTKPGSKVWEQALNVTYDIRRIIDIIAKVFKNTPDVKLTFGGVLKNRTSVEKMLSDWLTVEGPRMVPLIMNMQIDQLELSYFLEAYGKAKTPQDQVKVFCDSPGLLKVIITENKNKAYLETYVKDRLCRLDYNAMYKELVENFDIVKLTQSLGKGHPNWNWTDLAESGKNLVIIVNETMSKYGDIFNTISKLPLERLWLAVANAANTDSVDSAMLSLGSALASLQASLGPSNPEMLAMSQILEFTIEVLKSTNEMLNTGILYSDPIVKVITEVFKQKPDDQIKIINALFKPETLTMVATNITHLNKVLCSAGALNKYFGIQMSTDLKALQSQICNQQFYDIVKKSFGVLDVKKLEANFMKIFGPANSTVKRNITSWFRVYDVYLLGNNITQTLNKSFSRLSAMVPNQTQFSNTSQVIDITHVIMNQLSYTSVAMVMQTVGPIFEKTSVWKSAGPYVKLMSLSMDFIYHQMDSMTTLYGGSSFQGRIMKYVSKYGPEFLEAYVDMYMDKTRVDRFIREKNLTKALCDETTLRYYLRLPSSVPLKEIQTFMCQLDYQKVFVGSNEMYDKIVKEMVDVSSGKVAPKVNWEKMMSQGKKLYTIADEMMSGKWDPWSDAMMMLNFNVTDYNMLVKRINKKYGNADMAMFTGLSYTMQRSMELMKSFMPYELWKFVKLEVKMGDMLIVAMTKRMDKMTRYGIRLSDLFEAPSIVRDFVNASLSITPELLNGVMNMMLDPNMMMKTLMSNPNPCGGRFFTSMFPRANPRYVRVIEKMICNTSMNAVSNALMKEPIIAQMVTFVQNMTYMERNTTKQGNHTVTRVTVKYRDVPVNFTELVLHQMEYSVKLEKMIQFNGVMFPDVPAYNQTAVMQAIGNITNAMKNFDVNRFSSQLSQAAPLVTMALMNTTNMSAIPKDMMNMVRLYNTFLPVYSKRMNNLIDGKFNLDSVFVGFPNHMKLVKQMNYLPKLADYALAAGREKIDKLIILMTKPQTMQVELCKNPTEYFVVPPNEVATFKQVMTDLCTINAKALEMEFYQFLGVDLFQKLEQEVNSTKPVNLTAFVMNLIHYQETVTRYSTILSNTSTWQQMKTPLWLEPQAWGQVMVQANKTLAVLTNTTQMFAWQEKIYAGLNPLLQGMLNDSASKAMLHAQLTLYEFMLNMVKKIPIGGSLSLTSFTAGYPEMQKVMNLTDYFPQAFEILMMTMTDSKRQQMFLSAVMDQTIMKKICSPQYSTVLLVPSYLLADFIKLQPRLCAMNTTKFMVEVNQFAGGDLIKKLNESMTNTSPVNFTRLFSISGEIGLYFTAVMESLSKVNVSGMEWMNVTQWLQIMDRIGKHVGTTESILTMGQNTLLMGSLRQLVNDSQLANKYMKIVIILEEFLVKELKPLIGTNLTLETMLPKSKYPNLVKLTGVLDYSPQIIQVLMTSNSVHWDKISPLFTDPQGMKKFCTGKMTDYVRAPAGTEVTLQQVHQIICSLDVKKLEAEFNDRSFNMTAKITKILTENSTTLANIGQHMAYYTQLQTLYTQITTSPPKPSQMFSWMNPQVWQQLLASLAKNDTASIVSDALMDMGRALSGVLMAVNNTGDNKAILMTQQAMKWINAYLIQGSTWNPFALIENTTELNKIWGVMKHMPTVMDLLLNTMSNPSQNNALIDGLLQNATVYLGKICKVNDWKTIFTFDPNMTAEVNQVKASLCSLDPAALVTEMQKLAQTEFGNIINIASTNTTGPVDITKLFSTLNQTYAIIMKLTNQTKMPSGFNPANYPLLNGTLWMNVFSRFWREMEKTGNNTNNLLSLLAGIDPLLKTIISQSGNMSGQIQQYLQPVMALSNLYSKVVATMLNNTFTMNTILGQGSEIQKITSLFNAMPDFAGLMMLTLSDSAKSSLLIEKLVSIRNTSGLITLCKSDWNQFMATPPAGSSLKVADVKNVICSLNMTLLGQQVSAEFGSLLQFMGVNVTAPLQPLNFSALAMKMMQTSTMMTQLMAPGRNMSTTSLPWADEKKWAAMLAEVAKETQNPMRALINGIETFSSVLTMVGLPQQQTLTIMHIMNHAMQLILNKLQGLNQTHIVLEELFKSPELKKLMRFLDNSPELFDVLSHSMQMNKFWNLTMEKDIAKAFFKICAPSPLSNITDYFSLPQGSGANLTALKTEFCKVNITNLQTEAMIEFDVPAFMKMINTTTPLNKTMMALRFFSLYQQIEKWVKYKPTIDVPRFANASIWLQTMTRYMQQWNNSKQVNEMIMKSFMGMIPLFEQDQGAIAFANVLNAMMKVMSKNLKVVANGNMSLYDLVKDVPQLKVILKLGLNMTEDMVESLLYTATFNPAKLYTMVTAKNPYDAACNVTSGIASAIHVPAGITIDAKEIQRLLCTLNVSTMQTEILTGFGFDQLMVAIVTALNPNVTKKVDWIEMLRNSQELSVLIQKLIANPPKLAVKFDEKTYQAIFNNFMKNFGMPSNIILWMVKMNELGITSTQGTPVWDVLKSYYTSSMIINDFLSKLLGRLTIKNNVVELDSLFKNTPTVKRILGVAFNFSNDLIGGFLSTHIKVDKFIPYMVKSIQQKDFLQRLVCNATLLMEYFVMSPSLSADAVTKAFCGVNETVLLAELQKEFDIMGLMKKLSEAINGTYQFDLPTYLKASSDFLHHINRFTNMSGVTMNRIDLLHPFNMTRLNSVYQKTMLQFVAELPKLEIATFAKMLDNLMPLVEKQSFWNTTKSTLNFINTVADVLNKKVTSLMAANLTLDKVLKNSTTLTNYMKQVFASAPQIVQGIMGAKVDIAKIMSVINNSTIHTSESVRAVLCNGGLSLNPATLTTIQKSLCNASLSTILNQMKLEINYETLYAEIKAISSGKPTQTPFKWNSTLHNMRDLVQNFAQLVATMKVPSFAEFFVFQGNLTVWEQEFLKFTSQPMKLDHALIQIIGNMLDSVTPMLMNNTGAVVQFAKAHQLIVKMMVDRLKQLVGKPVTLNTIFTNATQTQAILQTFLGLDTKTVETLLRSSIQSDKLVALIASKDPLKTLCTSGLNFLSPPSGATLNLSSLQSLMCKINTTTLQMELANQLNVMQLMALLNTTGVSGPSANVNWTSMMLQSMDMANLITELMKNPPKVDSTLEKLFNLTKYSPALMAYVNETSKIFTSGDINKILVQLQPAMLAILGPLQGTQAMNITLTAYHVTKAAVDFTNKMLMHFSVTNKTVNIGSLLSKSTRLPAMLKTMFGLGPTFASGLMASAMSLEKLLPMIVEGPAAIQKLEKIVCDEKLIKETFTFHPSVNITTFKMAFCGFNATLFVADLQKDVDIRKLMAQIEAAIASPSTPSDFSGMAKAIQELIGNIQRLTGVTGIRYNERDLMKYFNFSMDASILQFVQSLPPAETKTFAHYLQQATNSMENTTFWRTAKGYLNLINIIVDVMNNKVTSLPKSNMTLSHLFKNSPSVIELLRTTFNLAPVLLEKIDPYMAMQIQKPEDLKTFLCETAKKSSNPASAATICKLNETVVLQELMREINYLAIIREIQKLGANYSQPFNWTTTLVNAQHLVQNYNVLVNTIKLPTLQEFFNYTGNFSAWMDQLQKAGLVYTQPGANMDGIVAMIGFTLDSILTQLNVTDRTSQMMMFVVKSMDFFIQVIKDRMKEFVGSKPITLEAILKNATYTRETLRKVMNLDSTIVEALLKSTVNNRKLLALLGSPNITLALCNSSLSEYFTLPSGKGVTLNQVQQALCKLNLTQVQMELAKELNIPKFMLWMNVTLSNLITGHPIKVNFTSAIMNSYDLYKVMTQLLTSQPGTLDNNLMMFLNMTKQLGPVMEKWLQTFTNSGMTQSTLQSFASLLNVTMGMLGNATVGQDIMKFFYGANFYLDYLNQRLKQLTTQPVTLDVIFRNMTRLRNSFVSQYSLSTQDVLVLMNAKIRMDKLLPMIGAVNTGKMTVEAVMCRVEDYLQLPTNYTGKLMKYLKQQLCTNSTAIYEELKKELRIEELMKGLTTASSFNATELLSNGDKFYKLIMQLVKIPPNVSNDILKFVDWNMLDDWYTDLFKSLAKMDPNKLYSLLSDLGPLMSVVDQSFGNIFSSLQQNLHMILKTMDVLAAKGFDIEKFLRNATALEAFLHNVYSLNPQDTVAVMNNLFPKTFQVMSTLPQVNALVCNKTALGKVINAPAYMNVGVLSGAICNKNGSKWLQEMRRVNVSESEIMNLHNKLQGFIAVTRGYAVSNQTHSLNMTQMVKDMEKLAVIMENVQKLPPGFIPGFNDTYWRPIMTAFTNSLNKGSMTMALMYLNYMDPLMRDQKFWNQMKQSMSNFASLMEYINKGMAKLHSSGTKLELVNLFPSKEDVVKLLSPILNQGTMAEFLMLYVNPMKYLDLLQSSRNATDYFCDPAKFRAVFVAPKGSSVNTQQIQKAMCEGFKKDQLRMNKLFEIMDIRSLSKEIQRLTNLTILPQKQNPFEYFITQIQTFVRSATIISALMPNASGSDLVKWLRPIEATLNVMLEQTPNNFGYMCDSVQGLMDPNWFKDKELQYMQLALQLEADIISAFSEMEPVFCSGRQSSLPLALSKLLKTNFTGVVVKLTKIMKGEVNEAYQCSKSITASNTIYESFDKLIKGFMKNPAKPAKCIQDFFMQNFGMIGNVQGFFNIIMDFQKVMKEDLFNATSNEIGSYISTIIGGILQQQNVTIKMSEIFKNTSTVENVLLNLAKVTPDVVNVFLKSTVNIDSSKFENMTDARFRQIMCSPSELEKYIRVPPVFQMDFKDLSQKLCAAVQKFNITQLRDGINLARIAVAIAESNNPTLVGSKWLDAVVANLDDIYKYGGSLIRLVEMVPNFDLDEIVKMLPKIQQFLIDNSPEKVFDSLVELIQKFDVYATTPKMKRLVADLAKFANGLRHLKIFKFMFNVHMKDLIKDEVKFTEFLIVEIGLTRTEAVALMNSSFSFVEMEFIVKKNITAYFCDPLKLGQLLNFTDKTVKPGSITSKLCAVPTNNKTADVMERLIEELDISHLLKTYVRLTSDKFFKTANVSKDELKDMMQKVKPLISKLDKYLKELSEFTKELPEIPAKIKPGDPLPQTSPSMLSSLSSMLCGSTGAMAFKDEFGIAEQLGETNTESTMYKKELGDLKKKSCQEIYKSVRQIRGGSIVWAYIKPLILGKIPFSPDNEVTRQIMRQANSTFEELDNMQQMLDEFVTHGDGLRVISDSSGAVETLKNASKNPFVNAALNETIGMTGNELVSLLEGFNMIEGDDLDKMLHYSGVILNYTECVELDRYVGVKDEPELVKYSEQLGRSRKVMAAISFIEEDSDRNPKLKRQKRAAPSNVTIPKHIKYKIRVDIDNTPNIYLKFQEHSKSGPGDDFASDLRYLRAFVPLQDMIDKAIISAQIGKKVTTPSVKVKQFPYPCYQADNFYNKFAAIILPLLMVVAWLVFMALAIKSAVCHREIGIEETLKVMGMSSVMNFLSWFFSTMICMVVVAIIMVVILKLTHLLPFSNWLILILLLTAFSFSSTMMCFMIAAFFNRANLAALTGLILFVIGYMPYVVATALRFDLPWSQKTGACLLSPSAFSFAATYVARYEEMNIGIQWHNVNAIYPGDSITFSWACIMMVIDAFIYFIIGWYIRNVFPGKYGMPQPFYFPFLPRYWGCMCCDRKKGNKYNIGKNAFRNPIFEDDEKHDPESFLNESEPSHLLIGISVHHLTKKYRRGKKVAVNNLSVNFYEGQITALLGQNGAGKTSTINMLCGIFPPSSGTAYINGKDIWTHYTSIRKMLGYCPQHNVLFDSMTVREHLFFFGRLKGILGKKKLKEDVQSLLDSMGLNHFKNEKAINLSGGMKRRLSVAIAFVGGSRVVILDEPTAGVDPAARRNIWDLIVKHKEGRTILLTTHHLDEADILADRIAVMHQGKLLCTGSSLFLKNRFGRGYLLTLSKVKTAEPANLDESVKSFDTNAVMEFVNQELPGAYLEEEIGSELRILLPSDQRDMFHHFFTTFNTKLDELKISSYGVSDTTMEEVFLSLCMIADAGKPLTRDTVNEMHHECSLKAAAELNAKPPNGTVEFEEHVNGSPINGAAHTTNGKATENNGLNGFSAHDRVAKRQIFKHSGISLKMIQFFSLLVKRFHHHRRYLRGFLAHIIMPCLFIAFAMWTASVSPRAGDSGARQMSPALYGGNVFYRNSRPNVRLNNRLTDALLGRPGIGSNCLPGFNPILKSSLPCKNQTKPTSFFIPKMTPEQKEAYKKTPKCSCANNRQVCPKFSEGYPLPRRYMNSSETLYKLDMENITDWILRTFEEFPRNRFGGWEFGSKKTDLEAEQAATVWFNNRGLHSLPSYINGLSNTIQRAYVKDVLGHDPSEYGITVYNHPLPMTKEQLSSETILQRASHLGTSIVIITAYCFIPAGFIIYLVKENLNQEKRLQFVYGVGPVLYWMTAIIWDMISFAIPVGISAGIMYAFGLDVYTEGQNLEASVVLLMLFGWAVIPFCYMMVRRFKDSSTAFMTTFIIILFSGIAMTLCTFLLGTFVTTSQHVKDALYYIEYIFLVMPAFALGDGFIKIARNQILASIFSSYGEDTVYKSPFTFEMLGWHFVALGIQGLVFLLITILQEAKCGGCTKANSLNNGDDEDEDVAMETQRVLSGGARNDMLVVKGLAKYYRSGMHSVRAVDHVSVGVPAGDCFGLLGLNGAGKTTTFKMLTGEVVASGGKARLFGKDITACTSNMSAKVGYCPQFDALDRHLTGHELLRCYARLKGITGKEADRTINTIIQQLHLEDCVKKTVQSYSGGMRRRLSIGVAMLGDPDLILLDEPTAGMDPQMRRHVWTSLMSVIRDQRSVVFTSHKMDECEFLCTRIGIMVNGQFRCLGSPQHLRTKFGEGYTLTVRLVDKASPHEFTEFIQREFPGAVLKEHHFRMLEFSIPSTTSQLPNIFGVIEKEKHVLGVEDYSVNQTTLDQVFVNFSRDQDDGIIDTDSKSDEESNIYPNNTFQPAAFENKIYDNAPGKKLDNNPPKGEFVNPTYDNVGGTQYEKNIMSMGQQEEMSTKL